MFHKVLWPSFGVLYGLKAKSLPSNRLARLGTHKDRMVSMVMASVILLMKSVQSIAVKHAVHDQSAVNLRLRKRLMLHKSYLRRIEAERLDDVC